MHKIMTSPRQDDVTLRVLKTSVLLQSDSLHHTVMDLVHSEDRNEFKQQLNWRAHLPQEQQDMTLQQVMMPGATPLTSPNCYQH